jgi:hypothetical protein
MANRARVHSRTDARHWLPSQGVDPAPLAELNSDCLGLLAVRASETDSPESLPALLAALHGHWALLPAQAVRRLAAAPFSLFEAGFAGAPRWLETCTRGVHDPEPESGPAYFESRAARSITRRMLVYGWHLSRSRPRAACLVFGVTMSAVESLAACSLTALEVVAEHHARNLRPRWQYQFSFWQALLDAASGGQEERLQDLLLGGIQRLAADTLSVHAP